MTTTYVERIRVRLLSLNLYLRPLPGKNDYKSARTKHFVKNIIQYYDIICLQEVFRKLNSRARKLMRGAAERGLIYSAKSPKPPILADGGLIVLSKYEIIEQQFIGFNQCLYPDSLCWKGLLYVKIKVGQQYINLITTQLQTSYACEDPIKFLKYRHVRRAQIVQLRDFIDRKISEDDCCLVAGDFNVDGREKNKNASFEGIPCQDDYEMMVNILSRQGEIKVTDLLRKKSGYSAATYGRIDSENAPLETTLTPAQDQCSDRTFDYIFVVGGLPSYLQVVYEETGVVSFNVHEQPFTQISTHAGLQSTFSVFR